MAKLETEVKTCQRPQDLAESDVERFGKVEKFM